MGNWFPFQFSSTHVQVLSSLLSKLDWRGWGIELGALGVCSALVWDCGSVGDCINRKQCCNNSNCEVMLPINSKIWCFEKYNRFTYTKMHNVAASWNQAFYWLLVFCYARSLFWALRRVIFEKLTRVESAHQLCIFPFCSNCRNYGIKPHGFKELECFGTSRDFTNSQWILNSALKFRPLHGEATNGECHRIHSLLLAS